MKHKVFSLLAVVAALAACQSVEIDGVSGATALPLPLVPVVFEPMIPFVETLEAAALDAALPPWVIDVPPVYWTMPEQPERLFDDTVFSQIQVGDEKGVVHSQVYWKAEPAELIDDTPAFVIDVGTAPNDAK